MTKRILTYGTFDLFHIGHLRILERLADMADELFVGVSTDEFNELKGKKSIFPYSERADIIGSMKMVTQVIPEKSWDQKEKDIKKFDIDIFAIGDDWAGKFDHLQSICDVTYLPRTEGISSTQIKKQLSLLDQTDLDNLHKAITVLSVIQNNLR